MKSIFISFLFLLSSLFFFISTQLQIPLTQTSSGYYVTTLKLGTPSYDFDIKIETSTFLLWVGERGLNSEYRTTFDPIHSSSYKNLSIPYTTICSNGLNYGILSSDLIQFSNITTTLSFGLARYTINPPSNIDGVLGLGYKYKNQMYLDDKFNLIASLKENNHINKNVFSIKNYINPVKSTKESILFIGDYPSYFINSENKKTGFCGIVNYTQNSDTLSWNCRMSYLIKGSENTEDAFKSNHIELNETVVFDYGSQVCILREKLSEQFKAAFKKSECEFVKTSLVSKELHCKNNAQEISLVFNGIALKLSRETIYEYLKESQMYRLLLTFSSDIKVSMIGQVLFNNYEILFDEELSRVGFHTEQIDMMGDVSKYTTDNDKVESNNTLIIIIAVVGLLIVIAVAILLIWHLKKKEDISKKVEEVGDEGLIEI